MQPSQLEIQREVEALRDIRRRSTSQGGPGALILDPDLPNPSSPTSPTAGYWSAATEQQLNDGDSSSGSHEDTSSSEDRATTSDDPFHLFWVPARLHPEIAPAEFRAFLKEHARTPPPESSNPVGRSGSLTVPSPTLERRRSMLSRQYKPSENDDVEEEQIVPLRRNRTVFTNAGPQLSINDLQRIEELAEEASKGGDPSKFRTVLRRSISLNVSPSAIDEMDNIPPMLDEADAPIIVPRPGQILRRAARTKIRKTTLPGDGGGHRFGPGRRRGTTANVTEPRTSSDLSSNDHISSEQGDSPDHIRRPRAFSSESISSEGHTSRRPDSYSEETSIYDAYVVEEPESEFSRSIESVITPHTPVLSLSLPLDESKSLSMGLSDGAAEPPSAYPLPVPELQHPQPQRHSFGTPSEESSRTPSPDTTTLVPSTEETDVASTSSDIPVGVGKTPSPVPKKEKDKKGLFGKWGSSDKNGKKSSKAERDRERDSQRAEKDKDKDKEKEKESGFFGSLFGGKKKQEDQSLQAGGYGGSGRETAAALLGASKSSKGFPTSPSPQPGPQGAYASHIKLANPRRPLYEQVLISNLMFWYLGVINKTPNPTPTAPSPQAQPAAAGPDAEGDKRERERQERERETKERERERERERELQLQQQKEKSRRGTGRRAAEMPVKGPQYEVQHRVMENEYNGSGYGYVSPSSSSGGPSPPPEPIRYIYPGSLGSGGADPHLPPASRTGSSPSPPPGPHIGPVHSDGVDSPSQALPPQRSRSPPSQNHNRYSPSSTPWRNAFGISHSKPHGKARKAISAHAVVSSPNGRPRASVGSVPDLPLALWQQQRRRR
ncbi:hypothetical protein BU15DRAFT_86034 [Melanogaster broomeanus]|nr:hypothetical protein BU15DRAFT_86034 [Melanogaster broomeanus]